MRRCMAKKQSLRHFPQWSPIPRKLTQTLLLDPMVWQRKSLSRQLLNSLRSRSSEKLWCFVACIEQ